MHPMLNIAVRAARNAGDIIARYSHRVDELKVASKERNDFVSQVDRQAEDEIIAVIRKAYPDHGILAEESGQHGKDDDYQWIIDPLDGTTNFLHGMPQFAVSIALQHKGRLEQADDGGAFKVFRFEDVSAEDDGCTAVAIDVFDQQRKRNP